MALHVLIYSKYKIVCIKRILKKNPWIKIVFIEEEIYLFTYNELYRLSKLPIKLPKHGISLNANDVKNEISVSFLTVLQLLRSNNEHLLIEKLKMSNYRLDRTRFCAKSVFKYLVIRYFFKLSDLDFKKIITKIKSEAVKQENPLFYDSYLIFEPHDDFVVGIEFCSDAELFILSSYESLVLSNTYIDMSMNYYVGCHRHHSERKKNQNEYEDLSFDFLDLVMLLFLYENPQRFQRGLNYQLALANYNMDRSTFKASSVVEFLALQDPHSFKLQDLIAFYYCETEEGKVLLKDLKSVLYKKKS